MSSEQTFISACGCCCNDINASRLAPQVNALYHQHLNAEHDPNDFDFIQKVGALGTCLIRDIENVLASNVKNQAISEQSWKFICDFYSVCCFANTATITPQTVIDLSRCGDQAPSGAIRKRPFVKPSDRICKNPIAAAMSAMGAGYVIGALYFLFGTQ